MKRLGYLTSSTAAATSLSLSSAVVVACASCAISQVSPANTTEVSKGWAHYWAAPSRRNPFPRLTADNPVGGPNLLKTHIEWKFHHGTGGRVGRYDNGRYIADFEYADGTPAPISQARHALMSFHDRQLYEMIISAAVVEGLAATNRLPRIPGVREQREWDPEIPLFLDDMDDHGAAPSLSFGGNLSESARRREDPTAKFVNKQFSDKQSAMNGKTIIKNPTTEGESLTPITMFANYSPAKMFTEERDVGYKGVAGAKKPSPFDRRRWNMTDNFLVHKGPRAKNTIGDGQVKSA